MLRFFGTLIFLLFVQNAFSLINWHELFKIYSNKEYPGLSYNNTLLYEDYLTNVFKSFKHPSLDIALSKNCAEDLQLILEAVKNIFTGNNETTEFLFGAVVPSKLQRKKFLTNILVLDSYGKIPPGLFKGAFRIWGYEPECSQINFNLHDRDFQGSYSRVFFNAFFEDGSKSENCYSDATSESTVILGAIDVCTPKSCANNEDLMSLTRQVNAPFQNYSSACSVDILDNQKQPMTYKSWIVAVIICALTILGLIGSFIDYFVPQNWLPKNMAYNLFQSFAITKNIQEIFTIKGGPKTGQIEPIHCIRFFSICWVVLGHSTGFSLTYFNNSADFYPLLKDVTSQILANAYFAVDSFFFISGVLLAFLWFKEYKKNKHSVMSVKAWIMFYVHRILRISPPYFLFLAFNVFVFYSVFIKNMPIYMLSGNKPLEDCKYWWTHLLYLNNFLYYKESDSCMGITWYLATDMQMFIFTPILLIPLAIKPFIGLIVASILFFGSTAANIATVYKNHYGPNDPSIPGNADPKLQYADQYDLLMYNSPWIRCQIYIMGLLVGYFLQYTPELKLSSKSKIKFVDKLINIILWILSLSLMLTVALSLKNYYNHGKMTLLQRALYSSLSKPAWGLGLSWIIISCFYGPINQFMSWKIWVPLSRLSYCVYLTHVNVLTIIMGFRKSPLIFSGFLYMFATFTVPAIFFSFLFSVYWSATFEIPFAKIQTLLFRKKRVDKPEEKQLHKTYNNEATPEKDSPIKTTSKENDAWA